VRPVCRKAPFVLPPWGPCHCASLSLLSWPHVACRVIHHLADAEQQPPCAIARGGLLSAHSPSLWEAVGGRGVWECYRCMDGERRGAWRGSGRRQRGHVDTLLLTLACVQALPCILCSGAGGLYYLRLHVWRMVADSAAGLCTTHVVRGPMPPNEHRRYRMLCLHVSTGLALMCVLCCIRLRCFVLF
jgi:hypothetical protein